MNSSLLFKEFTPSQTRLITGSTIAFVILAVVLSVWLQLYDKQYLRTSVPVTAQESQPPASKDSKLFSIPGVPASFKYPASWDLHRTSDSGVTFLDVQPVQIWIYSQTTDPQQNLAARALATNGEQLISYPGDLGNAKGTYFARASVYNATQAPYGQRVFITQASGSTVVVLLPQPPYTEGENRFMSSFALK